MRLNLCVLLLAAATGAWAGAVPAFAQDNTPGGLFGSAPANPDSRQFLDLRMSLIGSYNSDAQPGDRPVANLILDASSIRRSSDFLGNVDYRWERRDVKFRLGTTSALRHDLQTRATRSVAHTAALALTAPLPRRTTLRLSQDAGYSPAYLYNLFPQLTATEPGEAANAASDYSVSSLESYSFHSEATLLHEFTRRNLFTLSATGDRTDYRATADGRLKLDSYGVSGRFSRQLTRNTSGLARYNYREGDFPSALGGVVSGRSTQHGVEIGMTHAHPLSRTRQLTVDVTVGGTLLTPPDSVSAAGAIAPIDVSPVDDSELLDDVTTNNAVTTTALGRTLESSYQLAGQVMATYNFAKAWNASATYRRGVDFVPGIPEPVATNGITARIEGLITNRLDAHLLAGYVAGQPALSGGQGFDTYMGNARLRFALAQTVALYVEGLYYIYDLSGYPRLIPETPASVERIGVRVGLTLLVPALGR